MKKKPRLRPTHYFIDACKVTNLENIFMYIIRKEIGKKFKHTVKCSYDGIDQLRQFIITLTTKENTC